MVSGPRSEFLIVVDSFGVLLISNDHVDTGHLESVVVESDVDEGKEDDATDSRVLHVRLELDRQLFAGMLLVSLGNIIGALELDNDEAGDESLSNGHADGDLEGQNELSSGQPRAILEPLEREIEHESVSQCDESIQGGNKLQRTVVGLEDLTERSEQVEEAESNQELERRLKREDAAEIVVCDVNVLTELFFKFVHL